MLASAGLGASTLRARLAIPSEGFLANFCSVCSAAWRTFWVPDSKCLVSNSKHRSATSLEGDWAPSERASIASSPSSPNSLAASRRVANVGASSRSTHSLGVLCPGTSSASAWLSREWLIKEPTTQARIKLAKRTFSMTDLTIRGQLRGHSGFQPHSKSGGQYYRLSTASGRQ